MSATSEPASKGKALAKSVLFLLPCIAAWVLASIYLLPKLEETWMTEIPWPGGMSALEKGRSWFRLAWTSACVLLLAVPLFHLLLRSRTRARSIVTGSLFWLAHATTFFGLLYMILATQVCYLKARSDLGRDVFGSAHNLAQMASSQRVVMTRLHLEGRSANSISNYRRGEEVVLSPEQALEVKTVFLDKDFYAWGISRACAVNYNISFLFADATPPLEVAICFSCSQFAVFVEGKDVTRESLMAVGKFRDLAKQMFPNDVAIQALGTKKR